MNLIILPQDTSEKKGCGELSVTGAAIAVAGHCTTPSVFNFSCYLYSYYKNLRLHSSPGGTLIRALISSIIEFPTNEKNITISFF